MGEYVNSTVVKFDRSTVSCGMLNAHHLPRKCTPRQTLFAFANALYHKANPRPACFICFSDVIRRETTAGEDLANFIAENPKLGALLATSKQVNPRTGNTIVVWIFTPEHEEFRKWYTEETMHRLEGE
jgi:hypothetical protein